MSGSRVENPNNGNPQAANQAQANQRQAVNQAQANQQAANQAQTNQQQAVNQAQANQQAVNQAQANQSIPAKRTRTLTEQAKDTLDSIRTTIVPKDKGKDSTEILKGTRTFEEYVTQLGDYLIRNNLIARFLSEGIKRAFNTFVLKPIGIIVNTLIFDPLKKILGGGFNLLKSLGNGLVNGVKKLFSNNVPAHPNANPANPSANNVGNPNSNNNAGNHPNPNNNAGNPNNNARNHGSPPVSLSPRNSERNIELVSMQVHGMGEVANEGVHIEPVELVPVADEEENLFEHLGAEVEAEEPPVGPRT